jgi:hypothetical protein
MPNEPLDKLVFIEFKERVVQQLDELTKETKSVNTKLDSAIKDITDIKIKMEKFAEKNDIQQLEKVIYRLANKEEIIEIHEKIENFVTKEDFEKCRMETKDNKKTNLANWVIILAAIIAAGAAIWAALLK